MAYFYFIVLFICTQTCMECMEVRRQLWELLPSTFWVPSIELKLLFLLISPLPTESSKVGVGFMILVS